MSHNLVELVRGLRPEDAGRVDELFPPAQRRELFREIVSSDQSISEESGRRRLTPSRHARWCSSTIHRVRRPVLISSLGAVAAAAVAAGLIASSAMRPQAAAAGVAFRTGADGDIIATVTDPFAAESQLKAAFAEHGLDITVNLLPVSPSLVGTVVFISDSGGASAIQPLQGGPCVTGGGGCSIGVKIPATFTGQGDITLGRPAKSGETYESQASAFAPGEVLHCSGLLGARVATALPVLKAKKLTPQWRERSTGANDATAPTSNYIWDALMQAPGTVMIWTSPTPRSGSAAYTRALDQGC
ncbi:MAG: hypothetical protein ABSC51_07810 [Gaiellaceae bacterium]|jgi:hypothetical protein